MTYTRAQIEAAASAVGGTPSDVIRQLLSENAELLNSHYSLIEMVEQHADFANGVTDPTGIIDEGRVFAGEQLSKFRTYLESFDGKRNAK